MNTGVPSQPAPGPSAVARLLKTLAAVEAFEVKAVLLSMFYFLFLFGSYSVIKPVRDAMGTVYGVKHLQELFTVTLIASLVFAPLYAGLASRMKLSTFLPWVYGFVAATILVFYALFASGRYQDRWIAAAFYVWVSTFNLLIISVFWTFILACPGEAAVRFHRRRRHHRRHRGTGHCDLSRQVGWEQRTDADRCRWLRRHRRDGEPARQGEGESVGARG